MGRHSIPEPDDGQEEPQEWSPSEYGQPGYEPAPDRDEFGYLNEPRDWSEEHEESEDGDWDAGEDPLLGEWDRPGEQHTGEWDRPADPLLGDWGDSTEQHPADPLLGDWDRPGELQPADWDHPTEQQPAAGWDRPADQLLGDWDRPGEQQPPEWD